VDSVQLLLAPSSAGPVPVRHYRPKGVAKDERLPALLYYHGGGWVIGDLDTADATARALANRSGAVVVSVDYRLAPEHPFPASLDDARSAYLSLLADGTPADQVAVAGDSSGAGLVLSLLLALRNEGRPMPGRAVLMCPWIDLPAAPASRRRATRR
jgi:acetyl esterase/lipase